MKPLFLSSQICLEKDAENQTWLDVPPVEGAFIVNIGDMLERWSNDLFRYGTAALATVQAKRLHD